MGGACVRTGLSGAALAVLLLAGTASRAADSTPPQPGDAPVAHLSLPDPNAPAAPSGLATGEAVTPAEQASVLPTEPAASEEPAEGEDAALQDEIDELSVEAAPSAEPQADTAPGPRVPRHGVPVPQGGENFPTSPVVDREVEFWVHAFTAMNSQQGLLHDGRIIAPIYETVELGEDMKMRKQNAFVKQRIRDLGARLNALADRIEQNQPLDEDLARLRALLPPDETPDRIRERVHYVRFQRGLSDRFRNGLIRSGAILDEVRRIMAEHGVPADLAYLPHVESSFNNATLSKAGAAGIWQFTRGTGRIFLTVQGEVDERLDPVIAARAAAIFLKQNYERLGTWPLAITAYNHGPQSLEKIVARTGTVDLGNLIENYDGPLFKFASKNFYAEFLAARRVATQYREYFGELELARPQPSTRVELPFFLEFDQAARTLGLPRTELAQLNPSLRPSVVTGAKHIPKGFRLKVPAHTSGQRFLAAVPDAARSGQQKISTEVRVARGDTLFSIGRRNNIPWPAIAAANNLGPRSRLFVGQRLMLPRPGQAMPMLPAIAAAQPASPAPAAPAGAAPPASAAPEGATGAAPVPALAVSAARDAAVPTAVNPAQQAADAPKAMPIPTAPAAAGTGLAVNAALTQAVPSAPPSSPLVSGDALALKDLDAARQEGVVRAAYGETVGHYADWALVSAAEIRERNNMGAGGALHPGRRVVIPLHAVTAEAFNSQRMAYHRAREASFFASYTVQDRVEVRLGRGQSVWAIAQEHNVPMWLLYRENPSLLERPVQAGMRVIVPQVQIAAAGR